MKDASKGKRDSVLLVSFCTITIFMILINTAFMRFWLYDSQNRLVKPEHYDVEIITREDHKQLANPENQTVKLSNGTTKTKGDVWDSLVLQHYKSVNNGSQYVRVTTRGTAAFIQRWYYNIIPILCMCVVGLFIGLKHKRTQETDKETE
jgi:hypothetical protein